jgi:hypothetical protein
LIISRAGATTSAELMAAGKAAIMIPLPGQLEQQRTPKRSRLPGRAHDSAERIERRARWRAR